MVEGILYMWVRNLASDGTGASLAWSDDHGKSWTWAYLLYSCFPEGPYQFNVQRCSLQMVELNSN